MRLSTNAKIGLVLLLCGCASRRLVTVWQNTVDPRRNYGGDSQECELIATALANNATGVKPLLRAVLFNDQWERCMIGRNWRLVAVKPSLSASHVAVPTSISDDPRWMTLIASGGRTIRLDTAHIERPTSKIIGGWVSVQPDTVMQYEDVRYWKIQTRTEFDCHGKRRRALAVAVYLEEQKTPVVKDYPDASWLSVAPESVDEFLLQRICRAFSPSNP